MSQALGELKRNRSVPAVLELELLFTADLGRQAKGRPGYMCAVLKDKQGETFKFPWKGHRRLHRTSNI